MSQPLNISTGDITGADGRQWSKELNAQRRKEKNGFLSRVVLS